MKELGTKTLETNRLVLRKFKLDDVESYHNNWSIDELTHQYDWYFNLKTIDDTKKYIENTIDRYKYDNYYNWVIVLKDTNEVIGHIGVNKIMKVHGYIEIGYSLSSKYFKQGIMTEALKEIINFFINEVGVRVIEGTCISENEASINLMKKVGMNLDAVLPKRRVSHKTGNICDEYIFSIIK
ncbi:MAG: GNAT family N-acetyltransferase [Bacilli bacterium]|nr:GNAT family N-acetyltransferase [Bacilli bacterium]